MDKEYLLKCYNEDKGEVDQMRAYLYKHGLKLTLRRIAMAISETDIVACGEVLDFIVQLHGES